MCGGAPDVDDHSRCIEQYASIRAPKGPLPPPLWIEPADSPPVTRGEPAGAADPSFAAATEPESPDKVPI